MALFRFFFKTPKHHQFEYKPRYYDPEKEELQQRLKKYGSGEVSDTDMLKERISHGFRQKGIVQEGGRRRGNSLNRNNRLLLIIILGLILMTLFLLDKFLPQIVRLME